MNNWRGQQTPRGNRGGRKVNNSFNRGNFSRDYRRNADRRDDGGSVQVYRPPQGREVHFENSRNGDRSRNVRRGGRARPGLVGRGKPEDPSTKWYKVSIPHGTKSSKEFIVGSMNAMLEKPFTPFNFHTEGNAYIFFVQGEDIANELKGMNRRISAPNGFKIVIIVSPSNSAPQPRIDDSVTNMIKEVMSKRYNLTLKLLDLSNFRNDPSFQEAGLFVPLSRVNILAVVTKIIKENIPDMVFFDVSDNNIVDIEPLSLLGAICPFLKGISLAKNKIRNITELDHLKDVELEEISISGNPVVDSFNEHSSYVSSIRTRFPKVLKLDGESLPAPIGFDVGEETLTIPESKGNFVPESIQQFVSGFLEQFYSIYDSPDRQALMAAYHDNAVFSFSIARADQKHVAYPQELIQESRNLMKIQMSAREKLLRQGKVSIVAFFGELPESKHVTESFSVDVPFHTEALVVIVVNGVYMEAVKKMPKQCRFFCRTFTIIPHGAGFVVINDTLMVGNSTFNQRQKYSVKNEKVANFSMVPVTSFLGPSTVADKEAIVRAFVLQTRMTASFAVQCLEENNFDITEALRVFSELNKRGVIPPEAFSQ